MKKIMASFQDSTSLYPSPSIAVQFLARLLAPESIILADRETLSPEEEETVLAVSRLLQPGDVILVQTT
jgi:hypothetical protein